MCIIKRMAHRTHSKILRDAELSDIAKACRKPESSVRSWIHRDSIPPGFWLTLDRHGYTTLEELAHGASEIPVDELPGAEPEASKEAEAA